MPRQPSPRSRAIARLDDFRAGVYAVALHSEEWRERAQELADASAGMRAVQNSLERASAECADIQRLVSEGTLSRDNAERRIAKALAPLQRRSLVDARLKFEAQLPPRSRGFENDAIAHLFTAEQREHASGWTSEGSAMGPTYFKPRRDNIDNRRDPLPGDDTPPDAPPTPAPTPINDCRSAPFARGSKLTANTGVALFSSFAAEFRRLGQVSASALTQMILLGGGGSYAEATIGRDSSWPSGYSSLTITADIDYSLYLLAISIGISGAGTGADLILDIELNGNAPFRITRPLGAIVAPIFWWADYIAQASQSISTVLSIPSTAGTVRISAGIRTHSAAGGLVSTAAMGNGFGTITRLCAVVR